MNSNETPMTVKRAIELLSTLDPDMTLWYNAPFQGWKPVNAFEVHEGKFVEPTNGHVAYMMAWPNRVILPAVEIPEEEIEEQRPYAERNAEIEEERERVQTESDLDP